MSNVLEIGPVCKSPSTYSNLHVAKKVAKTNVPVLITGESGTGKEVFAQKIHALSGRKGFVAVNCAAIPDDMFEAVMFGYEKGAFTGALQALPGKFEHAHEGTIFLDEISEIAPKFQAKLLRVLQEREVERLGSHRVLRPDFRVLAASNRDLKACVENGQFREDLYHRLSMITLELQPLRERKEDIASLIERFLGETPITDDARASLMAKEWPGNIRELKNVIERAKLLKDGPAVDQESLGMPKTKCSIELSCTADAYQLPEEGLVLNAHVISIEAALIKQALDRFNGVIARAAEHLGLNRTTLVEKMRRYGIER